MKINMKKTPTIDLKGKNYATVPARIKEFREQCPNGDIETKPDILTDGQIMFTARILRDKRDSCSASATGHAIGANKGDKAFEKLETIAIGRALAILGFMASGEIASSEEMEEFEKYKEERVVEASEKLKSCKTLDELKTVFLGLGGNLISNEKLIAVKDNLKLNLK